MKQTLEQQRRHWIGFRPCAPGETVPPRIGDAVAHGDHGTAYVARVEQADATDADPSSGPVAYWYRIDDTNGHVIAWLPLFANETTTRPRTEK